MYRTAEALLNLKLGVLSHSIAWLAFIVSSPSYFHRSSRTISNNADFAPFLKSEIWATCLVSCPIMPAPVKAHVTSVLFTLGSFAGRV